MLIFTTSELQIRKNGLDLKLQRYEKKPSGGVSGGKRGSRARKTANPGRRSLSGVPFGVASGLLQNREPLTDVGEGSPLWVGGELLSHGLPQYHRRGGA